MRRLFANARERITTGKKKIKCSNVHTVATLRSIAQLTAWVNILTRKLRAQWSGEIKETETGFQEGRSWELGQSTREEGKAIQRKLSKSAQRSS